MADSISMTSTDNETMNEEHEKMEAISTNKEDSPTNVDENSCHLLEGRWTFWYTHRPTTFRNSSINYDSCLKKLGSFGSIEEFWCYYDHMKFPVDLPFYSDIHLFAATVSIKL